MTRLVRLLLPALIVASCGTPSNRFRLEGKFRGFNQGELLLYSTEGGGLTGIDTIQVREGRFSYERPWQDTVTLSLVFPNYSEVPIFAQPGTGLTITGDASHLKETEISGSSDNEAMTAFRISTNDMTPPEAQKAAADYIGKHPDSRVSLYLLNRYFIMQPDADYKQAAQLATLMQKAAPANKRLATLCQQLQALKTMRKGSKLPHFSVTDHKGRHVSNASMNGDLNVISAWASWSYESVNQQKQLQSLKQVYGSRLYLLSVCVDGNPRLCQQTIQRDSFAWPIVNDGQMWNTPLVSTLGISNVPECVLVDRSGTVLATGLSGEALRKEIKSVLDK